MRSKFAGLAAGACLLLCIMAASAMAAEGPALDVPGAQLRAALQCPVAFTHPQHEPVLLVHGTGVDADSSWSWNYGRALPAAGFDVCTVDLPGGAVGDMQVSAEYVVYAVRWMHAQSGRKIDIIGHSLGPLPSRWAIKWWPDVRADVDDLVGLASPNHGIPLANAVCLILCDPGVAQFSVGSAFLRALNAGDETPGDVDQTSIISRSDGAVFPASTAVLQGASTVVVQDLCPGRIVVHARMLFDAAVYAMVLDALTHPGPTDRSRVSRWVCLKDRMPKVTYVDVLTRYVQLVSRLVVAVVRQGIPHRGEPPLEPYAAG
jgi:triacylglycerol lipase